MRQPKLILVPARPQRPGCCEYRRHTEDIDTKAFAESQARYNDQEVLRTLEGGPLEPLEEFDHPARGYARTILAMLAIWLVITAGVIFFAWVLPVIRGAR